MYPGSVSLPPPFQSARSAPGVSAAPRSQPASPRLRHDRHRAPPAPLYSSGSYQECCCYECDYGRGRPPPLPPESPGTTIGEGGEGMGKGMGEGGGATIGRRLQSIFV